MNQESNLQVGQRIFVSGNVAIVSKIYPDTADRKDTIEIVYLLQGIKPIYEDAHWIDGEWRFVSDGQVGDYAIDVRRLRKYLLKLPGFHPPKRSAAPKKGPNRRAALKPKPRSLRTRR